MKIRKISLKSIDSTNAYAKKNKALFEKDALTVIQAQEQTAGYGQFQRPWVSPKGVNLYVSFFFTLPLSTRNELSSITLEFAKVLKKVLTKNGFSPTLKWPNDVLINGKKVAGVLCETTFSKEAIEVILGFGLNVNMEKEDLIKVDQQATSLKNETNTIWDKEALLDEILEEFQKNLLLGK